MTVTNAGSSSDLLLEITHCPIVAECLLRNAAHPCGRVVGAQHLPAAEHHRPEPWNGQIETAPLLFVSSNPSFNPREHFPNNGWRDDEIVDFFTTRFKHSDQSSFFWRMVWRIAEALLGRAPNPGLDYALTEVVRCKSRKEEGVAEAVRVCSELYLSRTFEASGAKVIIALGKKARNVVGNELGFDSSIGLKQSVASQSRLVLMLGHPSAAERKKPTLDEISAVQARLASE